ncbi:hypothetical protein L6164_007402 [Bauhinia variegata]|uniref:Uncharacterized protein n=1 Tax=Bauhinia variegata TaxID=167791 RepID=A0ACB9PCK3_BAUVA|nr:hypothetical protein L6164_007402 [Bauhinia variegata]
MAGAMKKVDKIRQIVRLKQMMMRWKQLTLRRRSVLSDSNNCAESESKSKTNRRTPPGFLAVYVGMERQRFVIPARFLNLRIFKGLLKKAEEEFGFQCNGGLVLPCEVGFFKVLLKHLNKDEGRFGKFSLEEFVKIVSDVGSDSGNCKETVIAFTPLLQKARV